MKKKFIKIVGLLTLLFLFVSCASKVRENIDENFSDVDNNKIKVVTTIFPAYDIVKNIVKDTIDVSMLIKPGVEIHSFNPTPKDIKDILEADLFIYIGGESDKWVDDVISANVKNGKPIIVKMVDWTDTVYEETVDGAEVDETEEDEEELDEHFYTNPINMIEVGSEVLYRLTKLDTDKNFSRNNEFYEKNFEEYENNLKALDEEIKTVVNNSKTKTLVFGDRFPFRYFADRYGLKCFAAFNGCSTDTETTPTVLKYLMNKVKEENLKYVMYVDYSSGKIADAICEEVGAKKEMLYSTQTISNDEFINNVTYIDLMRKNLEVLRKALN